MRFTPRLLQNLYRRYSRDPRAALAIRLRYDGVMTWQIAEGRLTTTVAGGTGAAIDLALSAYTLGALAAHLGSLTGYSVPFSPPAELSNLSALVLLDGDGDQDASNGDHLRAYTAPLYAYLEALAVQLGLAADQVPLLPAQMATTTAEGTWLDQIGALYGVPRLTGGEPDRTYGQRIIAEVLRPRGNNVAIEIAIAALGGPAATVTDVVEYGDGVPKRNGVITRNSAYNHTSDAAIIYGLFDAEIAYDLEGAYDPAAWTLAVKALVERLRDAGTQLRSASLVGGALSDDAGMVAAADDTSALTVTTAVTRDGTYRRTGARLRMGYLESVGTLEG